MSGRYARMFASLADRGENALIPFFVLGDPDPESSLAHIEAAVAAGADALELGIPFSDPVADGPVIAAAARRALAAGATSHRCLEIVERVRARHADIPVGLLVYVNPVFAAGIDAFYAAAAAAGADSVLIADLPLCEAAPFRQAARQHRIAQVFILPQDAGVHTLAAVAAASEGYTYVLGRRGVTGAERAAGMPPPELFAVLKTHGAPPAVIGFGVSAPEQVRAAREAGAAGVIVGSALVQRLADGGDCTALIAELKAATRLQSPPANTCIPSPPRSG